MNNFLSSQHPCNKASSAKKRRVKTIWTLRVSVGSVVETSAIYADKQGQGEVGVLGRRVEQFKVQAGNDIHCNEKKD